MPSRLEQLVLLGWSDGHWEMPAGSPGCLLLLLESSTWMFHCLKLQWLCFKPFFFVPIMCSLVCFTTRCSDFLDFTGTIWMSFELQSMKMIMHCIPLADVSGWRPVPSIPKMFLTSTVSCVPIACFLDLQVGLAD